MDRNLTKGLNAAGLRIRTNTGFAILLFLLFGALALGTGCSSKTKSASAAQLDASATDETPPSGSSAESPSNALPEAQPRSIRVPGGTVISVRLLQAVSSRTAHSGDEFVAELASPITADNAVVFPRSARVRGRVVAAHESGRLKDPGYLRLTLDAVQSPGGDWVNVRTTSISASGKSHKKRDWTLIGGGSGLGALIGGLAGGGKGLAIGAASGAAAGTAGAYATGKRDVTFSAERKLNFATIDEIALNR